MYANYISHHINKLVLTAPFHNGMLVLKSFVCKHVGIPTPGVPNLDSRPQTHSHESIRAFRFSVFSEKQFHWGANIGPPTWKSPHVFRHAVRGTLQLLHVCAARRLHFHNLGSPFKYQKRTSAKSLSQGGLILGYFGKFS